MARLTTLKGRVATLETTKVRALHQTGDEIAKSYHTHAWRKLAASVIKRDAGMCHICGKPGADTAHHLIEKRDGGTDDPRNLRAVHRECHNKAHPYRKGWGF
ncbi:MAG: HNH endonuclease [Clostridiaceae bacterium]|nr:HNH endonuclease [Clostridiaceae bacterium]